MFTTITARHAGTCKRCGFNFEAGTRIRYGGRGRTYHLKAECPAVWAEPAKPQHEHVNESTGYPTEDTGRYVAGHRVYRDGSYREDFRSDC